MAPTPDIIDTPNYSEQKHRDNEEPLRLEAEIRSLELRKQELQRELPGDDSRLRHDARFPDSDAEEDDVRSDGRLSLDGDEPPVR